MSNVEDSMVTAHPYFRLNAEEFQTFLSLEKQFIETTEHEPDVMYYGFSTQQDGDITVVFCREAYPNAEALMAHIGNVLHLLQQLKPLEKIEIHGNATEIDKLREFCKPFNAQFFILRSGFNRVIPSKE